VAYSFPWAGNTPQIVTMTLLTAANLILESYPLTITTTSANGSFEGLDEGEGYKIRLTIGTESCEDVSFTTQTFPCITPTLNAPILDHSNAIGTIDGNSISTWQAAYDAAHP